MFVGGKGGVGKTTSSSAIGIKLADSGLKTLIVSTDPAHSLGDALDIALPHGQLTRIPTETNLWALEIDIEESLAEFKAATSSLNAAGLSEMLGIPRSMIDSFGLEDLTSLFTNPPPGIDEVVALSKIVQYGDSAEYKFDRIIIDTAPTGHTLRLLQLPKFVNSMTGNLIKLRTKIVSAVDSVKNLFGGDQSGAVANRMESTLDKLENLQKNIQRVQTVLKDPKRTEFVVVTIPTSLAVAESKRLVSSLQSEGIKISTILCNQVLTENSGLKYMETRKRAQTALISSLQRDLALKQQATSSATVDVTQVPYFDTEITGIYGLRFFSNVAHVPKPKSATNPIDSRKLSIFGGKGGVGKTTTSASWAIRLCDSGMKTLIVSSDPAHSLGDSLKEELSGLPKLLESTPDGGQLWAMEIDPEAGIKEFKEIFSSSVEKIQSDGGAMGGMMSNMGLTGLADELKAMVSSVSDPPPGTDEIVALTKIIMYLDEGFLTSSGDRVRFDRIVLDTAPTGHTLRMLTLPEFLRGLIGKVKTIRDKTGLGGVDNSIDRLSKFEKNMEKLEDILHSPKETEFVVVTIATEVALAETKRLLDSLQEDCVFVRRLIINQILPDSTGPDADAASTTFMTRSRKNQDSNLLELSKLAATSKIPLIKVPYFDMETRSVYGLRFAANTIFSDTSVSS